MSMDSPRQVRSDRGGENVKVNMGRMILCDGVRGCVCIQ